MGRRASVREEDLEPLPPPATTLEGRQDQMIALATNLVERRLRDGTASSQETVHFLRMASTTHALQEQKLRAENEVLLARVQEMEDRKSSEATYSEALNAFRGYSGQVPIDPEADGYDDGY